MSKLKSLNPFKLLSGDKKKDDKPKKPEPVMSAEDQEAERRRKQALLASRGLGQGDAGETRASLLG